MNKKFLALIGLIILLAGGGAAYFLLFAKDETQETAAEQAEPAAPSAPKRYVLRLDTIHIPIVRKYRSINVALFQIEVELNERMPPHEAYDAKIRIVDGFVQTLMTLTDVEWPNDDVLDLNIAKIRLRKKAEEILGSAAVKDVIIVDAETRSV